MRKKKHEIIIDGVKTSDLTRENLETLTLKLREELDREREQRSYFQLERDKISSFWEITRKQARDLRRQLLFYANERVEESERTLEEEKIYLQQVRYLQYEQVDEIKTLKAEIKAALCYEQVVHAGKESQLSKNKRDLRIKLRELEIDAQINLRKANSQAAEDLLKSNADFDQKILKLEENCKLRLQIALGKAETARRADLAELVERNSKHFQEIVHTHEKAFEELKNNYNDITLNNLGLLNALNEKNEHFQQSKEGMEKDTKDALAIAKGDSLAKVLEVLSNHKRLALHADKNRRALTAKSLKLTEVVKSFEKLSLDYGVLEQKCGKATAEKQELRDRLSDASLELYPANPRERLKLMDR